MKKISVLGSTGSIGSQAVDVISRFPKEFKIVGLAALNEVDKIYDQAMKFNPRAVCLFDESAADELKKKLKDSKIEVVSGLEGLERVATLDEADSVYVGVVGAIGLKPTLKAIKNKKNLFVPNKETLVCAGEIVMNEVAKAGVDLLPVDGEHCAIYQCLIGEKRDEVKKLIITCSGGPFRKVESRSELENVTAKEALAHPTWKMGGKISIDSATLFNKGLEVIEAHWLFSMPYDKIDVVVHPQSIVHSMVEFVDGSIKGQLSFNDMRIAILFSLAYPKRLMTEELPKLDLIKTKQLDFEPPKHDIFPAIKIAYDAGRTGGTMPALMNAANEEIVWAFLDGKLKFLQIPELVKKVMDSHSVIKNPSLNEIIEADKEARVKAKKEVEKLKE